MNLHFLKYFMKLKLSPLKCHNINCRLLSGIGLTIYTVDSEIIRYTYFSEHQEYYLSIGYVKWEFMIIVPVTL